MSLNSRRSFQMELPEFLILALEQQAEDARASAQAPVDLRAIIEWHLAEVLSLQDVARMERRIPGFAAAVRTWLETAQTPL